MTKNLSEYDEIAILIGGGAIDSHDRDFLMKVKESVFCADAGLLHAKDLGLDCVAVFGDFDSVTTCDAEKYGAKPIHLSDQDDTDFGKSLAEITKNLVLCFGFVGDRLDHSLSAMNTLAKHPAGKAIVLSGSDLVLRVPKHIALRLPPKTRISLFPMSSSKARSNGLKWPLDGLLLTPDGMASLSNETNSDQQSLIIDEGNALMIIPREHLEDVILALRASP